MDNVLICVYALIGAIIISAIIAFIQYNKYRKNEISIEKAKRVKKVSYYFMTTEIILMVASQIILQALQIYELIYIVFIIIALSFLPTFMFIAMNMYIQIKETKE